MAQSPGRNDPCHCGSGEKYKNCCQGKDNSSLTSTWATIAIVVAILVGLAILGISLVGEGGQPDCAPGTVWSAEHQHCH